MKLILDTDAQTLRIEDAGRTREHPLYSREAFESLSDEWLRVGWAVRHYFTFTWLGQPILQLPEDLVRLQEVVWRLKPDVIVETGIYSGGSLLFHATLCEAAGKGRVVGIDQHIDSGIQDAISRHPLGGRIRMLQGDSTAPETITAAGGSIKPSETVMVLLDSNHKRDHVRRELEAYSQFVTTGSCIVVADGVIKDLAGVPGGEPGWRTDNPWSAARDFLAGHPEFEQRQPEWEFNESGLRKNITYWPEGWLWRR